MSSFTFEKIELPGGDQNAADARNVGGDTGTCSTRYSGFVDMVARANSRILPRSTTISNGSSVAPTSDWSATCASFFVVHGAHTLLQHAE